MEYTMAHESGVQPRPPVRGGKSGSAVRLACLAWLAVTLAGLAYAPPAFAELAPGSELSTENWQEAKGLLPDEFLECYRRGDFRHRVGNWSIERVGDEPVFREALDANRGRYDLTDDGTIIDTRTGQPPDYIYAWPFPDIDRADPKAAMKIVWNYFYTFYYSGNGHYRADLLWLSRRGLDRQI